MKRFLSICAVAAMAVLSGFGAGSGDAGTSGEPVVKRESPAVRAYNEGVELMKAKRFAQAQGKFEQAVKLDPARRAWSEATINMPASTCVPPL